MWSKYRLCLSAIAVASCVVLSAIPSEAQEIEGLGCSAAEAGHCQLKQPDAVDAVDLTEVGYRRTEYWFERSAGTKTMFELFYGSMAARAEETPFLLLEVGSLEGASAIWTAENILKHPDSLLVCLDLWGETAGTLYDKNMTTVEDRFTWNMAQVPNGERVNAIKGESIVSLSGLVAGGYSSAFDAVYVDASHNMKDVLGDAILGYRLLKVGGTMIFDDYASHDGVRKAVAALEEAFGEEFEVIYRSDNEAMGNALVARKGAERWPRARPARRARRISCDVDSTLILGKQTRLENFPVEA